MVIDRLRISNSVSGIKRLHESLITAMYQGGDTLLIFDEVSRKIRYFSRNLMCPSSGIAYPKPEPNTFSFNSPKGMCPDCKGLGTQQIINRNKIIPDDSISIKAGGIIPLGTQKKSWSFKQMEGYCPALQF